MTNYISFFDQESLLKLMKETGLSVYEIMKEIEPAANLDKDGRALSNHFVMADERYIDFYNVRGSVEISDEKRKEITDRFNEIGIKKLTEEKGFSIEHIFACKLSKASYSQLLGWRRAARKKEKEENGRGQGETV